MGRTLGYTYLLKRIKALWHSKLHIDMITVKGDYPLVRFSSLDDYKYAKFGGP